MEKIERRADLQPRSAKEADSVGYMSCILIQGCWWSHKEQSGKTYARQDPLAALSSI